jgi:hypothetical protein
MIEDDDRLLQALAFLPPVQRDIQRERRVRARCHSTIAARAARRVQRRKRPAGASVAVLAAAAVLCVYLAAMFSAAARLGGFL